MMASDLTSMSPKKRGCLISDYGKVQDPHAVFCALSDMDRIAAIAKEKASGYILVETKAFTFFPSLLSNRSNVLDYAIAVNYHGLKAVACEWLSETIVMNLRRDT